MSPTSLSPVSASGAPTSENKAAPLGPFARVERLTDAGLKGWLVIWLAAFVLHGMGASAAASESFEIAKFANAVRAEVNQRLSLTVDIEEEVEPPPPPEPEPEPDSEPEPEPEAPAPEPEIPPAVQPQASPSANTPPPAAAEAAAVLTAPADPNEPLDLTGDGFITGTGTRFSGGVTASNGTAKEAVRNPGAVGGGVPGANGKTDGASGPPPEDKSKPAGLPLNANWSSCPFPAEAEVENINNATVRIVVVVGADGKPSSVSVLSDPGFGFGRAARTCAMRFSYPVGLDKKGNPAARATKPFNVVFRR